MDCFLVSVCYVCSLYVWPARFRAPRDAPAVIARRFVSLAGACTLALAPLTRVLTRPPHPELTAARVSLPPFTPRGLADVMGLHVSLAHASRSVASTLGLAATLFLGPLAHLALDGRLGHRVREVTSLRTLIQWRNFVVAPLAEEFAFRACVAPALLYARAASRRAVIFASPLLFGVAHVHHYFEVKRRFLDRYGEAARLSELQHRASVAAILGVAAQFAYTSAFGAFAAFALLRGGHLAGPVVAHAFCNAMGFPDVSGLHLHPRRYVIEVAYVVGIVGFAFLVWPATDPGWVTGGDAEALSLWAKFDAIDAPRSTRGG